MAETEHFPELISRQQLIYLDTPVFIYYLEGIARYRELMTALFASIARGIHAISSTISITELFVGAYTSGKETVSDLEDALQSYANLEFVPLTFTTARESARLRASYSLKTPDAIHLATCKTQKAGLFITNDRDFKQVGEKERLRILLLDEFVAPLNA